MQTSRLGNHPACGVQKSWFWLLTCHNPNTRMFGHKPEIFVSFVMETVSIGTVIAGFALLGGARHAAVYLAQRIR